MKDYEESISFLGEWGTFQWLIFIVLSLNVIPSGYLPLSMVFLGDIPPHHCRVPFLNSSYGGLGYNLSIPTEELKGEIILSRCRRYTEKEDSYSAYSNDTEGCVDGWVFSKERYVSTIVTEWNLVCDDAWKTPFATTLYFFGVLIGSLGSGILSDRHGRKITFISTKVLQTLAGFLLAVSTSWELFCVVFFVLGLTATSYSNTIVLGSEILIKSARESFGIVGVPLCFGIGYAILSVFAYFIRDWRTLQMGLSVVGLLYMPLCWYVPESPRWLITQGRIQEAEAIIRAAAKRNGITPPENIFELEHSAYTETSTLKNKCKYTWLDPLKLDNIRSITISSIISVITLPEDVLQPELNSDTKETENESSGPEKYTWLDLLKTTNMRNITIINITIWIAICVTYFSLSLNISNLDGDPYLNNLISAATEFLGFAFVWFATHYAPRRFVLPFTLLLAGALQLSIQLVPNELSGLIVTLVVTGRLALTGPYAFIYVYSSELFPTVIRNMGLELSVLIVTLVVTGRLALTGAYAFIFVYSSELFPTVIRNMGLGVSATAAGIGNIVSPYIAYIGTYNKILPFILMGILAVLSGGLSLLLPETKGEKLPELIGEVKPLQGFCFKVKSCDANDVDGQVDRKTQTKGRKDLIKILQDNLTN